MRRAVPACRYDYRSRFLKQQHMHSDCARATRIPALSQRVTQRLNDPRPPRPWITRIPNRLHDHLLRQRGMTPRRYTFGCARTMNNRDWCFSNNFEMAPYTKKGGPKTALHDPCCLPYSIHSAISGHEQIRFLSPWALSIRPTGGQYLLAGRTPGGKQACWRV